MRTQLSCDRFREGRRFVGEDELRWPMLWTALKPCGVCWSVQRKAYRIVFASTVEGAARLMDMEGRWRRRSCCGHKGEMTF